jgi:hypothetical protein
VLVTIVELTESVDDVSRLPVLRRRRKLLQTVDKGSLTMLHSHGILLLLHSDAF